MSDGPGFGNAMAWAQFRLKGGGRTVVFWGLGLPAALTLLGLVVFGAAPYTRLKDSCYGCLQVLTGLQGAVLIVIGGSQVGGAIRRDMASGMIASHRLMPVSGIEAIAGYIAGSLAALLAAAGSFFLLGLGLSAGAQLPMQNWLMANLILLVFALLWWCGAACAEIQSPNASRLSAIITLLLIFGYGVVWLVPGLMVLAGPAIGRTVFGVIDRGADLDSTYTLSFFAQILTAVLLFAGAARKYRRQDVLTFTPWMGLGAVTLWAAVSMVGTLGWGGFKSAWLDADRSTRVIHAITACVSGLLLGLLPVTACAWIATRYRRRPGMRAVTGTPIPPSVACALCALVLTAIPATILAEKTSADRLVRTGLVLAGALLGCSYLARIAYRRLDKAQWPLAFWLGLTWLVPASVDAVRASYKAAAYALPASVGVATTFSPPGALVAIWADMKLDTTWGIGFQLLLTLALAILFRWGATPRPRAGDHP